MKRAHHIPVVACCLATIGMQNACNSLESIPDNTVRAIIVGRVSAQNLEAAAVAVHAIAYHACPDSAELGGGVATVASDGTYELIVISGSSPGIACVIVSALRKTPPYSDSVAAAPVMLTLRPTTETLDTAHVDFVVP